MWLHKSQTFNVIVFIAMLSSIGQAGVIDGDYVIRREYSCNVVSPSGKLTRLLYSLVEEGECQVLDSTCKWKSTIEMTYHPAETPSGSSVLDEAEFDISTSGIMTRPPLPGTGALHLFPIPLLGYELFALPDSDEMILENLQFPDYKVSLTWKRPVSGQSITALINLEHLTDSRIVGVGYLERSFSRQTLNRSRSELRVIVDVAELRSSPHLRDMIDEIPQGSKVVLNSSSTLTRK